MKKNILFLLGILPFVLTTHAQVIDGISSSSTTVDFASGMSPYFIADTSSAPLWQTGHSHKPFFGIDTTGVATIMTDTIHSYPIHANNWFVIKVPHALNVIVDFWHKYQTDSSHDGGIVEFSLDTGITWQNVKGTCNTDGFSYSSGTRTDNFYTSDDTLLTGEPAFTGNSGSMQYSRLQFFDFIPLAPPHNGGSASGGCTFDVDIFYVRFRFLSDAIADTLAGWIIDSLKIEYDDYPLGAVSVVSKQTALQVYPNPSYDGTFNFPALQNEDHYTIEVYNTIGERVLKMPYTSVLELNKYPDGLYFYRVTDGTEYYSGRLMVE